jgi:hypothetical protein
MKRALVVAVVGFAVLSASGSQAAEKTKQIPLVWRADTSSVESGAVVTKSTGVKLVVGTIKDLRTDPGRIGENREDEKNVRSVVTSDDVAAFCKTHLGEVLRAAGIDVADQGDVVLTGELLEFFVTEDNMYEGKVRLKLVLLDLAGKALWEAVVQGRGRRMGRSYKAENYQEAASEALLTAGVNLVKDASFQLVLAEAGRRKPAPATP